MSAKHEVHQAVFDFAAAAGRLLAVWEPHNEPGDPIDTMLTATYPSCITMSFDEYVAELWAWEERVIDALDRLPRPVRFAPAVEDFLSSLVEGGSTNIAEDRLVHCLHSGHDDDGTGHLLTDTCVDPWSADERNNP